MPKALEQKLKKEYGQKSSIPYKIMNKLGYMHGNKETARGKKLDGRSKAIRHLQEPYLFKEPK